MSLPTNGVALYTICNGAKIKYATLVDGTPRQYITLRDDTLKGHEQRIWEVSHNAETGIVTMKNKATGNYATVNDMTSYVVGDGSAQEFKLVDIQHSDTNNWIVIQEKDSDRMLIADSDSEGAKIEAAIIPDPKSNTSCWWWFTLLPGVASEGEETLLL